MSQDAQPLVSVLMTSYNREKYISDAIESVLASTYVNFEVIVVDDCSKDRTVELARSYAERDSRIKIYENEKNLGDYPNRNRAATYAKGKYLKYIDADDYIYPWGLELLISMMEQYPEAGWGLCSLDQAETRPFPFVLTPAEAYEYHYLNKGLFNKAPLSSIIRSDVFGKEGGFAPLRMVGDFEMWHRLAQKYNVVLMPQGIVWYRKHSEQEMKNYFDFIYKYEEIKVKYLRDNKCPLGEHTRTGILKTQKNKILKQMAKSFIALDLPQAKRNWKFLKIYNASQA